MKATINGKLDDEGFDCCCACSSVCRRVAVGISHTSIDFSISYTAKVRSSGLSAMRPLSTLLIQYATGRQLQSHMGVEIGMANMALSSSTSQQLRQERFSTMNGRQYKRRKTYTTPWYRYETKRLGAVFHSMPVTRIGCE